MITPIYVIRTNLITFRESIEFMETIKLSESMIEILYVIFAVSFHFGYSELNII